MFKKNESHFLSSDSGQIAMADYSPEKRREKHNWRGAVQKSFDRNLITAIKLTDRRQPLCSKQVYLSLQPIVIFT